MSNLMIRRNGGTPKALARAEEEPASALRQLMSWDPFLEMSPLNWPFEPRLVASYFPSFEVKETKNAYLFKADVPGVKEQDLDVTLTANRLTISGKREEEKTEQGDTYYSTERTYGSFSRSFTLPDGADTEHTHAELKGGVLTLAVPKTPEVQPKRIAVTSGEITKKS